MIPTFQRNQHFRKVSINKTFTHVQEQKKRCRRDILPIFRLVKNSLYAREIKGFYQSSFRNEVGFTNILNVSQNILAKN